MPTWKDILEEAEADVSPQDRIRHKYLSALSDKTGRNVIAYYSAWLQKPGLMNVGYTGFGVNDNDKNGFMAAIHNLDRTKGLDLILHTPGGDIAATESLVDYLRSMFDADIRAIVPQLAMSAGTMIALACEEVIMGKHSSLGPIDPQINNIPVHGILEEFEQAKDDITQNPASIPLWQPIISKYHPTLIGSCQKAIKWGDDMVTAWLVSGMFKNDGDAKAKAEAIIRELGSHSLTKSHSRHISLAKAQQIGIKVTELEADNELQDAILTVHHAFIHTMGTTEACKIIENHQGNIYVEAFPGPQI